MNGFLIDTNVLCEFSRRGLPDQRVKDWIQGAAPGSLYVSILTVAEIRRDIELLPPSRRRDQLEQWLETELLESNRAIVTRNVMDFTGLGVEIVKPLGNRLAESSKSGASSPG